MKKKEVTYVLLQFLGLSLCTFASLAWYAGSITCMLVVGFGSNTVSLLI